MLIQTSLSSCGLKIPPQEVLACRKFYRKEVLAVLTSNRKEVLAACRIQAQATRKKPQEVAGLRTQKEVLARALFLGCTVSSSTPEELVLVPRNEASVKDDLRPAPGFALKKGGTKKTTFTNEQKEIMIQFYDRQRLSQIRANPADVIKAMKDAGVPELKESQIKGWWSSYHRKQKQLADDMMEEARQLRSQQQGAGVSGMPRATDPLPVFSPDLDSHPAIPDPTIPDPTPNPAIAVPAIADPTVSVPTAVPNQPVQPSMTPQSWIRASPSTDLNGVTEWSFSESQSDIQGRTGSNACVFIALYMGKLCFENNLAWPSGNLLPDSWKTSLREALIRGNQIHDDLFDYEGINVTVDDAVAYSFNSI